MHALITGPRASPRDCKHARTRYTEVEKKEKKRETAAKRGSRPVKKIKNSYAPSKVDKEWCNIPLFQFHKTSLFKF